MRDEKYDGLPSWVGMFSSKEANDAPEAREKDWDLVEELKSWPVDNSPEAREARRIAGGLREMTPFEVAARASDEVKRRLAAFEEVWEFVISHDTDANTNGYDVMSSSVEGEWYEKGASEVLERIRSLMSRAES